MPCGKIGAARQGYPQFHSHEQKKKNQKEKNDDG
jgi:hypothetical protein